MLTTSAFGQKRTLSWRMHRASPVGQSRNSYGTCPAGELFWLELMHEQGTAAEGSAETPLHYAAWCNDWRTIRRLVAKGLDVNVRDSIGETPLHGAAACGSRTALRVLLQSGAYVDVVSSDGMTPLHWAAGWGNLGVVRALVRAGANPRLTDAHGQTATRIAVAHAKNDVVKWLADHCPDHG